MKKEKITENQKLICPKCKKTYCGASALSRIDNATLVCPECGTREALQVLGLSDSEIEDIIKNFDV